MARKFISNPDYPIAETAEGKLRGFEMDGILTFQGVKYANAKRFQAPTPVEKWEGVKPATNYGPTAPTYGSPVPSGEVLIPHRFWPENEDCQYLNIWTKSLDKSAKKPVIVWFHGGGYADGSSLEQVAYEGDALCEYGDVVVVTVNHRLNILGFLDMSSFDKKYANSCNAGMADLVECLKWINRNIAAFGGDPENVTIFGQSGGGGKVCTLLQIPEADGLFHRAILMSGGAGSFRQETDHRPIILEMLKALGYQENEYEKLETVPYTVLMKAYNRAARKLNTGLMWGPQANDWYAGHPLDVGFTNHAKTVPTIVSSVIAEHGGFIPLQEVNYQSSPAEKAAYLDKVYNGHGQEIAALFEKAYPGKEILVASQIDTRSRSSILKFMDERAASNPSAPAYCVNFALVFDVNGGTPAWHCSDIPFIFHNTYRVGNANIEGVSDRLEDEVAGALVAFARTGDPNHKGLTAWKPYTTQEKATMVFDRKTELRVDYDRELLETAAKYGPAPRPFGPRIPDEEDEGGRAWLY